MENSSQIYFLTYLSRLRVTETLPPENEIILASRNPSTISQIAGHFTQFSDGIFEPSATEILHGFIYPLAAKRNIAITTPPKDSGLRGNKRNWLV